MRYLLFIFFASFSLIAQNNPLYLDSNADVEDRLCDLMARMTLEEKVGQMCQYVGLEYLKKQRETQKPLAMYLSLIKMLLRCMACLKVK